MMATKETLMARSAWVVYRMGIKEILMARSAWVVYMMGIKEILMVRTAPGGSVFEPLERSIRQSYRQEIRVNHRSKAR